MNYRSNNNTILLIAGEAELASIASFLSSKLSANGTKILTASKGIDGIFAYNLHLPCIVIVDDSLPDMCGSSVCSIIRDSTLGQDDANIFLIGDISSYRLRTFADFFFQKPLQHALLGNVLEEFFYRRRVSSPEVYGVIGSAVRKQQFELPKFLDTPRFSVNNVFSAFSALSGDGIGYWTGPDGSDLYGFIFDNTGHDVLAYSQTSSMNTLLRMYFDLYQRAMILNLGKILSSLNSNLFRVAADDPSPVAVILFHVSLRDGRLYYAPAGMSLFYVDYGDGFSEMSMRSPVVGGFPDVDFETYSLPLDGIQRILFASDGLSELLPLDGGKELPTEMAKHDDVSGISVSIKR